MAVNLTVLHVMSSINLGSDIYSHHSDISIKVFINWTKVISFQVFIDLVFK